MRRARSYLDAGYGQERVGIGSPILGKPAGTPCSGSPEGGSSGAEERSGEAGPALGSGSRVGGRLTGADG